jgi:hypothetical protein
MARCLPNEICLVLKSDTAPHLSEAALASWQAHVTGEVNGWVEQCIKASDRAPDDAIWRAASDLGTLGAGHRLQPKLTRVVRIGSRAGHALCYVSFGDGGGGTEEERAERQRGMRDLVRLINGQLRWRRLGDWQITGAAPHWLVAAANGGDPADDPGPGPAGTPLPATPDEVPHPEEAPTRGSTEEPRVAPVVVVVLDTCPPLDTLEAAATGRLKDNWLLQRVLGTASIDKYTLVEPADLAEVERKSIAQTPWLGARPAMTDHGLFITGIIRRLNPDVELHLVRVLSERGLSDNETLTRALLRLPGLFPRHPGQRLVVNLSLMSAQPQRQELEQQMDPDRYRKAGTASPHVDVGQAADLDATCSADVACTINSLVETYGVLVVAAAGNDYDNKVRAEGEPRPEPRLPARFDNVFGVAAINGEGKATRYSNRGDMPVIGNGVAAWGGDTVARKATDAQKEHADQKPGGVSEHDAVVGLYTAETLPPGPDQAGESQNTTGWVKWAGTSFATPVISALAAKVWANNPSLSPLEVIRAVIDDYAEPVAAEEGNQSVKHFDLDLRCPVIPPERAGRR